MADVVERTLNTLRRMPENRACATCRKEDRFGHKNVCMKFRTFICSECKSAHQAFSHKCKSVTMSNWTREEVEQLKAPHGGNAANALSVFAKLAKDSDAYPNGCPADEVKAFVNLAYNELRWAGEVKATKTFNEPPLQVDTAPAGPPVDLFGDFGDFESPPPAVHSTPAASFDEFSKNALLQGTNYFEAFESVTPTTGLAAADLLSALTFDTAAPIAQTTRDAKNSMDELDAFGAFGSFESAAPVESMVASPASVIDPSAFDEPLNSKSGGGGGMCAGVGADLFTKLMASDLMATAKPPEPAATPMAKAATPMAKMSTAKTPEKAFDLASMHVSRDVRTALGADFVDMSAMRGPPAFKTPIHPLRGGPMHAGVHAGMHAGMHAPMRAGMFSGM